MHLALAYASWPGQGLRGFPASLLVLYATTNRGCSTLTPSSLFSATHSSQGRGGEMPHFECDGTKGTETDPSPPPFLRFRQIECLYYRLESTSGHQTAARCAGTGQTARQSAAKTAAC